ncbi:MAG: hypothetical protein ACYDBB_00780 [Armatimonadota bacterium]
MRRLLTIFTCTGMLLLMPQMMLFAADTAKQAVPPFRIKAKELVGMLGGAMYCEGNVIFTSSVNNTTITCNRLEGNTGGIMDATSLKATGNVNIAMTIPPKEAGKPTYVVKGKGEVLTYSMQEGNRVIRLEKDANGVRPVLEITDPAAANKKPSTVTGDVIEYNLETRKFRVSSADIGNEGGAQ